MEFHVNQFFNAICIQSEIVHNFRIWSLDCVDGTHPPSLVLVPSFCRFVVFFCNRVQSFSYTPVHGGNPKMEFLHPQRNPFDPRRVVLGKIPSPTHQHIVYFVGHCASCRRPQDHRNLCASCTAIASTPSRSRRESHLN